MAVAWRHHFSHLPSSDASGVEGVGEQAPGWQKAAAAR